MMNYNTEVQIGQVLKRYDDHHRGGNTQDIVRAYLYAAEQHDGKRRGTGEPVIKHPLRVARLVAEWGAEREIIMAALLHDVVEDCDVSISEVEEFFGTEVAGLVDVVTSLSDRDYDADHTLTKAQRDLLSDAKLQRLMNRKALYVKIADRIDNLSTISGVKPEKRIPKAEHTREILIPMAEMDRAYHLVDVLEELCFRTEHLKVNDEIHMRYQALCAINDSRCQKTLSTLCDVFDHRQNRETDELNRYHRYLVNFVYNRRSCISIFRQINQEAKNIRTDLSKLVCKRKTALYDLTLIVRDELGEDAEVKPKDVFFQYYDKVLSKRGFCFVDYCQTTHQDAKYFLIADEMENLYRFFIRTQREYQHFLYGSLADGDSQFALSDINEFEPRETYNEKIKVFRKDGSATEIEKGSTVLDFGFLLHTDIGFHFDYATLDNSKTQLPPYTRLNDGDQITIVTSPDSKPDISWFRYVKTSRATYYLVRYFQIHGVGV